MVEKRTGKKISPPVPFPASLRYDAMAGFLVFLIALPLCLAIGNASKFPPIAGVITAIVGGVLASVLSNSELTIKGPAAGLIAIVAGCVLDMQGIMPKPDEGSFDASFPGYRLALAVGVAAAVLQIFFGLFKAGKLGDFFPTAAVHGLLASIGVMIMIRQFLFMLGVTKPLPKEATELIAEYPQLLMTGINPYVAVIGLVSLAIMVFVPMIKVKAIKAVPVQVIVLVVAIPMAMYFGIGSSQVSPPSIESKAVVAVPATDVKASVPVLIQGDKVAATLVNPYTFAGKEYARDPKKLLVSVPLNFMDAFHFPDFSLLFTQTSLKWVMLFAIIASLESLLSAKAVDLIDPQQRTSDLNRDLFACGAANLVASLLGGLPMISEIVRSRANVDNGAKSRWSNAFHGMFLLLFVLLLPGVLNVIPQAALAAMLTFTGFRLAHPREFVHMAHVGVEQLVVFVATIVAVVCTDLLIGVLIGMGLELAINLFRGLPIGSILFPKTEISKLNDSSYLMVPRGGAVFTNWLYLRGKLETFGLRQNANVVLDLSHAKVVDHTVMEKLEETKRTFDSAGLKLEVRGLQEHRSVSHHPAAARLLPSS